MLSRTFLVLTVFGMLATIILSDPQVRVDLRCLIEIDQLTNEQTLPLQVPAASVFSPDLDDTPMDDADVDEGVMIDGQGRLCKVLSCIILT